MRRGTFGGENGVLIFAGDAATHKSQEKSIIFFFNFFSYIMEKVDLVIVGAEGVVENGGIINKVRTSVPHSSSLQAGRGH